MARGAVSAFGALGPYDWVPPPPSPPRGGLWHAVLVTVYCLSSFVFIGRLGSCSVRACVICVYAHVCSGCTSVAQGQIFR